MSALLTTTMPYMKVVIDTMIEMGIRDDYVILVGGAPLNEEFGKAIGADAYCRDAAVAVETAKDFMAPKAQPDGGGLGRHRELSSRGCILGGEDRHALGFSEGQQGRNIRRAFRRQRFGRPVRQGRPNSR